MCGRFVSATPPDQIASYFGAEPPAEGTWAARYNVAPTTEVFVVRTDGSVRRVEPMRWGLVPFWAKDPKVGNRMINARAESLLEKSAYRTAYRRKRCIVPADAFYEWRKVPGQKAKQPYVIERRDGEPLAFAGLWETWRDRARDDAPVLHSCTIITTAANQAVGAVHDRMPAILPASAWDRWLDPADADVDSLGRLLVPAPESLLVVRPVGTAVNDVRHDGPDLLVPVPEPAGAPDPVDGGGRRR